MEGGVLPVTGFPHDDDKVKEGNVHRQIEHGASTSISYITHAFVHGSRLGVIPSKRALLKRFGSSGVVVHRSPREVVVHEGSRN